MRDIAMTPPDAPVDVVSYDPSWPRQFQDEAEVIQSALSPWLTGPIEHVGSTAIPGLVAKPTIDIMAGVATLDASRPAIEAAAGIGYCYAPYQAEIEHWFCKPSPAVRISHLHLVPVGSPAWVRTMAFRDYLRAHDEVARQYEVLKLRLARAHRLDREAYAKAKHPFIERIAAIALEAGYGSRLTGCG
jgi:GrpB-like predicted nucleotidyltransferase (UPF0157 family)